MSPTGGVGVRVVRGIGGGSLAAVFSDEEFDSLVEKVGSKLIFAREGDGIAEDCFEGSESCTRHLLSLPQKVKGLSGLFCMGIHTRLVAIAFVVLEECHGGGEELPHQGGQCVLEPWGVHLREASEVGSHLDGPAN